MTSVPDAAGAHMRPSADERADMIRFWCHRASEGRAVSRARARVALRDVVASLSLLGPYLLSRRSRVDVLVVAHPDRGGMQLDDVPYVGPLTRRLLRRNKVLLLQMQALEPTRGVLRYPWLLARMWGQVRSRVQFSSPPETIALAERLAKSFAVAPNAVGARLRRLDFEIRFWERLLDAHRPSKIVLVDGYSSNAALVWIARRRSIATVEVQHGASPRSHVGYRMIGESTHHLAPDHFLAWNGFWRDEVCNIPGYEARVKVCPLVMPGVSPVQQPGAGILLIHQPTLSAQLAALLERLPDRQEGTSPITVKFHPGIQPEWQPRLASLCRKKGIAVVGDESIGAVLPRHALVVGWFSTVLYQAQEAGCSVRYLGLEEYGEQQRPLAAQGILPMDEKSFLELAAK